MDDKLRDSLMEWYLRFGEREVAIELISDAEWDSLDIGFMSDYIIAIEKVRGSDEYKLTPEGIEALKNGL